MATLSKQNSYGSGARLEQTAPTKSMQRTGTSSGLASTQPNNMLFTDRNGMMNRKPADANPVPMSAKNERIPQISQKGPREIAGPSIWVKKWVDYSSKYGLGYLLSNGASGVFFNDSTKIVLDLNC